MVNVLFVCSRNQWRSPTAEEIFKNQSTFSVRSAGTSPRARIKISEKLVHWADLIFVMEKKHREILKAWFLSLGAEKQIIVLNIPDEYGFMDADLVEMLKTSTAPYLNQLDYH
ncbi:low molecular weight protein tyrosine phosphatase family protein [Runella sp.]|uniref:low molecular weight protein tyrosine phosphatase family protein n=1 Tax=Runella sp. TaxID=1960881 RepID=UPI003D13E49C